MKFLLGSVACTTALFNVAHGAGYPFKNIECRDSEGQPSEFGQASYFQVSDVKHASNHVSLPCISNLKVMITIQGQAEQKRSPSTDIIIVKENSGVYYTSASDNMLEEIIELSPGDKIAIALPSNPPSLNELNSNTFYKDIDEQYDQIGYSSCIAEIAEDNCGAHDETVSFGKSNCVHGDEEKTESLSEDSQYNDST